MKVIKKKVNINYKIFNLLKISNNIINIDFKKVPIIDIEQNKITYNYNEYIFTEFFKHYKDKKYSYFLYSLIINIYTYTDYKLYGDILKSFFNNNDINDLNFYSEIDNLFLNLYYLDNNILKNDNIILIIYILFKLIYNKREIICNILEYKYKDENYNYIQRYTIICNNLKININNQKIKKFDFLEDILYIDKIENNLVLNIFNKYKYNTLILSKVIPFLKHELIYNLISEFIGSEFMCILECIYNIINKQLRLTHNNCFNDINNSKNYLNIHKLQYYIYNSNKIMFYRINKLENNNYKIIISKKCNKDNCICYINELYKIYQLNYNHINNIDLLKNNIPLQLYYKKPSFNTFVETNYGYTYLQNPLNNIYNDLYEKYKKKYILYF